MKTVKIKTIREETIIELSEDELVAIIREKYDVALDVSVDFEIHQDMLRGAFIRIVRTEQVKE